jgi:hypothetical protein
LTGEADTAAAREGQARLARLAGTM